MKTFRIFILFIVALCGSAQAQLPVLKFNSGKFKIVQFTDLHWVKGSDFQKGNDSTISLMRQIIKLEQPDLVILTGDIVVSGGALEGWKEVTQPMTDAKVPFAITFGNHDTETDITKKQALEFIQKNPYCMSYNADDEIDGVGNCSLPILSSKGDKNKWVLYLFDSNAYPENKTLGTYNWIQNSQIQWYRKTSDNYTKQNGNNLPSLAFFHIPVPEFGTASQLPYIVGNKYEDVCSPSINSGLVASFIEKKDILGMFVGHDHNDDFIVAPEGRICFAYGRKTGYNAAYHEVLERGARVINLYENERRFDSYIRTLSNKSLNYTFEQKIDASNYPVAEGTFIQNDLVKNWDDADWQKELKNLRDVGMTYLVFAPTLHTNTDNVTTSIYPTKLAKETSDSKRDLVDICLRNAQKAGFKVFLGLNFDEKWWTVNFDEKWLIHQMQTGNEVADELVEKYKAKYPETMYGWYWVWEVANVQQLNSAENKQTLIHSLNVNLDHLNKLTPDMPFMLCPFMNHKIGSAKENGELWKSIFEETHFKTGDIFAPQDCVGAGGLELKMVPEWFGEINKAVSSKPGLRFWSDAETFDYRFWNPASLTRFIKQLKTESPYVSKIITFAYSHYYSPVKVNPCYHNAYLQYVKTGKLPEIKIPSPISKLKITEKNNSVMLKWDAPSEKSTLAGYSVYRNGVQIGNVISDKEGKCKTEFTDKEPSTGKENVYEVKAYNCLGKESQN